MSNKIPIQVIPSDASITINVSGAFLERLASLITDFVPYKNEEHYREVLKHIKDNTNQDDPFVYHVKTLISLHAHCEMEAVAQGKVVTIEKEV